MIPQVPYDDILDVVEKTHKIEKYISKVFQDADRHIAMSAIMGAYVNAIFDQCNSFDEIVYYRNLFMRIIDSAIRNIETNKTEPTS